ncbi:MAG: hypothetical protein ABSH36_02590 [Solirubrobacteraceae bacterium]
MTTAFAENLHKRPAAEGEPMLAITIVRCDGSEESTELSASGHRALHLEFLHAATTGYVEIAAGARASDGELKIRTRSDRDHFLPGGGRGGPSWRNPLLGLAAMHDQAEEEVFVGVAPRVVRKAEKEDVRWTRCLWMDIDPPGYEQDIDRLLARRPAHLEIATAGGASDSRNDGHRHLIWLLSRPQVARTVIDRDTGREHLNARELTQRTGKKGRPRIIGYRDLKTGRAITNSKVVDWIERWNLRLIHHLGETCQDAKKVYIADRKCRERARVLRLAGTRNMKTGRHARIVRVDHHLAPYDIQALIGGLPDPPNARPIRRRDLRSRNPDPYRLIPAAVYFPLLAGIELPASGNIHCPSPAHPDRKASCSVSEYVFNCHSSHCEAQGTIYDLWALRTRGICGDALSANKTLFHIVATEVRERCRHLV